MSEISALKSQQSSSFANAIAHCCWFRAAEIINLWVHRMNALCYWPIPQFAELFIADRKDNKPSHDTYVKYKDVLVTWCKENHYHFDDFTTTSRFHISDAKFVLLLRKRWSAYLEVPIIGCLSYENCLINGWAALCGPQTPVKWAHRL